LLQIIGKILRFCWGVFSLTHFWVNSGHEIWPEENRNVAVSYDVDILTDDYFVLFDKQTDRCRQQERTITELGAC